MDTEQLFPYPVLCGAHLHCLPSFLVSAPVGGGPGQCPYFHLLFSLFHQSPRPIFLRDVLTVAVSALSPFPSGPVNHFRTCKYVFSGWNPSFPEMVQYLASASRQ